MNFLGLGPGELLLILVLALIVFGPQKLPEIGSNLGRAINEFRRASSQLTEELNREIHTETRPQEPMRSEGPVVIEEPAEPASQPVETPRLALQSPESGPWREAGSLEEPPDVAAMMAVGLPPEESATGEDLPVEPGVPTRAAQPLAPSPVPVPEVQTTEVVASPAEAAAETLPPAPLGAGESLPAEARAAADRLEAEAHATEERLRLGTERARSSVESPVTEEQRELQPTAETAVHDPEPVQQQGKSNGRGA